jgi:hypothetical protein
MFKQMENCLKGLRIPFTLLMMNNAFQDALTQNRNEWERDI